MAHADLTQSDHDLLYTETEAADPTSRIPMTSPNGRRTQYVSTEEAEQLAAKGWYRSKCEW